ncbi:hypothetical protein F53441_1106 [Fusarium austroafricanum]|uniref:Uncharacterized protein n=1 Tax=Fusarium austroafricanum TaxID=2364996 RepID=A0A8H4KSZ9_9HYPO|nr:hypothetical protein F53441_1106 [Fusarium austroafricanum]
MLADTLNIPLGVIECAIAVTTSSVLPGNGSAITTSIDSSFPKSSGQLVDFPTPGSVHSRETTDSGISPDTSDDIPTGTSLPESPSQATESIPAPVKGSQSTSVTKAATLGFATQETTNGVIEPSEAISETLQTSEGTPNESLPNLHDSTTSRPPAASEIATNTDGLTYTIEPTNISETSEPTETDTSGSPEDTGSASEAQTEPAETSQHTTQPESTELEDPSPTTGSPEASEPPTTADGPTQATQSHSKPSPSEGLAHATSDLKASTTMAEDVVVTGTDGTVATYVPEQNSDYISSTGGGKGGGGVIRPPPPTANPVPPVSGNEPSDKNNDGGDDGDDDASTKDDKSTVESTVTNEASTTTDATTTSDECTAATQPGCTRTVSYMTSDGTQIIVPDTSPPAIIPDDMYTAEVNQDIIDILQKKWAEEFPDEESVTTETGSTTESTTADEITATLTTESESFSSTSIPSTFTTKTRDSSDKSDAPASTTEEATITPNPCIVHAGPAVETPYCQCSTTVDGKDYYATTTLIKNQCSAYTEFPAEITLAPETGPITDAPIQQPITTTTDGTVLVWSEYTLDYINWPGVGKITQTFDIGDPSTVSTPVPTQTAFDNDGGGQCGTNAGLSKKGLHEACDRAINQFDDGTIYIDYASRYSGS